MLKFWLALVGSVAFCATGPVLVLWVVHDLPVTWLNIFLIGGIESFFILMAVELAKLVKQLWSDARETHHD